ncbi:MAG: FAD/NAD(P)-binding oxidoreductase, partial [Myxococcota bacterium]
MKKFDVVIVGGGTGGLTVASRLREETPELEVAIIEPQAKHYYQPIWTLVGGGVFPKEVSERDQAEFIPSGMTWLRDEVSAFDPDENVVRLASGEAVGYGQLVVSGGLQINWGAIPGLEESLGKNGVGSNYSYETVDFTWNAIRSFRGGHAIFTQPNTPIKCAGAPQKIMYLAEDYFRKHGLREKATVRFYLPPPSIFGVAKYAKSLQQICDRRDIELRGRHHLVEVRGDAKVAVFEHLDTGERVEQPFDLLHVTPPMSAPDFVARSPLAAESGFVEVDRFTTQHVKYENVFSLGDCSSLPTSKTGAAIRKQAPVLVANLLAAREGAPLPQAYDGYTSCPLVTGYGKLVLAEFDYDKNPA